MEKITVLGLDVMTTPVLMELFAEIFDVSMAKLEATFLFNQALPSGTELESFLNGFQGHFFESLEKCKAEHLTRPIVPGIMSGKATRAFVESIAQCSGYDESQLLQCIHPSAVIASSASIGPGTWVHPQVTVSSFTKIGKGVTLSRNCSIGHHCVIEDYVKINPGVHVASSTRIEAGAEVGIGAVCREGVTIGKNSMVGAGSVVVKDVPEGTVVMGVPAKIFNSR